MEKQLLTKREKPVSFTPSEEQSPPKTTILTSGGSGQNVLPDYTVVLGVDKNHLINLRTVLPNWRHYRLELFEKTFAIFFDRESTNGEEVEAAFREVAPWQTHLKLIPWPLPGVTYPEGTCKWDNQQRHKMLAGFIHVPPAVVDTPYWLKLDLDVIGTQTGAWVQPWWFNGTPGVIAPPWSYTKPADQMDRLDDWANKFASSSHPPLCIPRGDGTTMLRHHRICSWIGFFNTQFSAFCSRMASFYCGEGQVPVPSQDGYLWYMATRFNGGVVRADMRSTGWQVKANLSKAEKAIACLREESSI